MKHTRTRRWLVATALLAVLAAGCGDDGGAVREEGEGSASGSASGPASGSASGSASGVAGCTPVGEGGGTEVAVALTEWSVKPKPASVAAGKVTFVADNVGGEPHELVVVKGESAEALPVKDGKVDEDALPDGAVIGEIEAFPAGEKCEGTFELGAGDYVLFCNIVEEHDGERESHFEEGMHVEFTVS